VEKHGQSLNPHSTNHSQHQLPLNAKKNIASSGIYASLPSQQAPVTHQNESPMQGQATIAL
jgi:hypothetical protein